MKARRLRGRKTGVRGLSLGRLGRGLRGIGKAGRRGVGKVAKLISRIRGRKISAKRIEASGNRAAGKSKQKHFWTPKHTMPASKARKGD